MTDSNRRAAPDQAQRDRITDELDTCMLVEAAAGTGKTASMVARMVQLIKTGRCADISSLAAVTFTRKAAAELRARFQVALEKATRRAEGEERVRLERALASVEQCFTGTIHSFCGRLLRERPVEAGVDIAFEEIDEEADALLRDESWRECCARLTADDRDGLLADLSRLGIQLADLEDAFAHFALYPDVDRWPLPPEGRALEGLEQASVAIYDYVEHMRRVARSLPDETGRDTLISAFKSLPRIVSHYDDLTDPRQAAEVLERFDRSVTIVQKVWVAAGHEGEDARAEEARWNGFRETVAGPLLRAWRESRYAPVMRVMFKARELYDRRRAERGRLNFQDLLMKAAALLRDNPHVRAYFNERFTHLLVDEFQDTDPIQAEVMLLLTATDINETDWRRCRPRPGSLFVVGDPKQSIYRFRRADVVTYNEVKEIILSPSDGAPGAPVTLFANFRTVPPLVGWVNGTFEPRDAAASIEDTGVMLRFPSAESRSSPGYVALETGRAEGTPGELSGVFTLGIAKEVGNKDEATRYEADLIARFVRAAIDEGMTIPRTSDQAEAGLGPEARASDFMIITRYKAALSTYAASLQGYGVPHQVTGGAALNEVAELRLLASCINAVARADDPVALLAALRGEAFGISDAALFRFRSAGGAFSYNSPVPGALPPDDIEAFSDSFARLKKYHLWLSTLPVVPAIENIVADLGLMVLASARPGGDVQAGSLGKALELMRAVQRDGWATARLVDYLWQVVEMRQKYDGISAASREIPAVRVMNLHKVKGLEAPVVFLANAYGEGRHEVELHVDRSGGEVLGYMAVRGPGRGRGPGLPIAHPEEWERLSEREAAFAVAEDLRLRYVAATRAGTAMVVTERPAPGQNQRNAWRHFLPQLPADCPLPDPGPRTAPPRSRAHISAVEAAGAIEAVSARLAAAEEPTHGVRAAKELALSAAAYESGQGSEDSERGAQRLPDGEHGVEWGQAVHQLLELAMRDPGADLLAWARAFLEENEMDTGHARAAAEMAGSVTASGIWKRAVASGAPMSEVPFELMLGGAETAAPFNGASDLPTLVRGAIDLAFPEDGGWVLVDFKTDTVRSDAEAEGLAAKYAPQLAIYREAWERCTGEKVVETGLYFTSTGHYSRC